MLDRTSRRSPIKRKQPLRAKRRYVPAPERRHVDRVREMGCLVCSSPASAHHVTSDGFKRIARSDRRVVPLCPRHHQIIYGPRESVEALGHAGFTATYGIDLLTEADRLWTETCGG